MAKDDPFVSGFVIQPIAQALSRCCPRIVEDHHLGRNEFRIEAKAHHVSASGGQHQPKTVYRFAAIHCYTGYKECSRYRDKRPKAVPKNFLHLQDCIPFTLSASTWRTHS